MLMMKIPLPHYDKFVHKIVQVGGICLGPPLFPPPPPPPLSDLFKMWIWLPNSVLLLHQRLMVKLKCQ